MKSPHRRRLRPGKRLLPIVLCAVALGATDAGAFEIAGYKSGMTLDEVRSVAKSRGDSLIGPRPDSSKHLKLWELRNADGATGSIQFCDDALATLSTRVPQGIEGFATLTADFITAHGNPTVTRLKAPQEFWPDVHGITLSWTFGVDEAVHLDLSQISSESGEQPDVWYLAIDDAWCLDGEKPVGR